MTHHAKPGTEVLPRVEPTARGRFITFEGIDGAGKTTHLANCVAQLRARGLEVVQTREPGGTALAESLRELLLHHKMSLETELMLMFAARRDHLETLIVPALKRGAWVVCDRFTDSTYAYQGGGREMGADKVAAYEHSVHPDLQPDQTFYFDLAPEIAAERRAKARASDRFEAEDLAFFERVRQAYLQRVKAFPSRFVLIDATGSVADISKILEKLILTN
jgi:dTMP kinase